MAISDCSGDGLCKIICMWIVPVWYPTLDKVRGIYIFFFFKQKTAYEMRISDWSSDVCSSDLLGTSFEPCGFGGQRLGVGLRLPHLLHHRVGVVGQVDPAHVRRVGLRHFRGSVA